MNPEPDGGRKPARKKPVRKPRKPTRIAALEVAVGLLGVHEQGQNNWGPMVAEILRSVGISFPAPWCMATIHYCFLKVGVYLGGGASVGNFRAWADRLGKIVQRPRRGDVGCWEFTGDGWPDHAFFVEKVLRLGPVWLIQTIEGNTSSGRSGSQDDGGGVYRRRRAVRNSRVNGATFVRIPGYVR